MREVMIPNPENSPSAALFASKSLDLVWLTASYHSPCLTPVEARAARWYWRIDVTFGAWLVGKLRVVKANQLKLHECEVRSAHLIRNYLEELKPGTWDESKRIATAGPVKLPDDVIYDTLDLIRFGLSPAWDGWEGLWEQVYGEPTVEPLSPPVVPPPPPARRRRRFLPRRVDAGGDLL